jgi:MFS family permease
MPDWQRLVAERLAHIRLPPDVRREVVAEITAHFEECYLELLRAGSPDPEAQTMAQVSDWTALCRNITRAKEDRMSFARKVIMPGIAAMILALTTLKLLVYLLIVPQRCGPDTTCVKVLAVSAEGHLELAYLLWLVTLPLVGALAAALAGRMGARSGERLVAAISPALYLGIETAIASVMDNFYWRIPIYWVLVPAMACVIGAWPFFRGRHDVLGAGTVANLFPGQSHDGPSSNTTHRACYDAPAPARMAAISSRFGP